MTNASTASGYITEVSSDSLGDDELGDLFQQLIVGLTGLDPTMVRPRWQPQPPTQPPVSTNWCAVGVINYDSTDYPEIIHNPAGDGVSDFYRQERIDVLASFYGPNSNNIAGAFRDGLYVGQNHDTLSASGVKLRAADAITNVPELVNSQYIPRSDIPCSFMRLVHRTYPIRTIGTVKGVIITENGITDGSGDVANGIVSTGVAAVVQISADNGDSCVETISQ
jgi:hypothetical protein